MAQLDISQPEQPPDPGQECWYSPAEEHGNTSGPVLVEGLGGIFPLELSYTAYWGWSEVHAWLLAGTAAWAQRSISASHSQHRGRL